MLNKEQREKIIKLLEWESLGESILTPLLSDPSFEEIVINGSNKPIMVYHNAFGWLTTNCCFSSDDKIKTVLNKMAAPLGRQLSFRKPILNAVLKNGSRMNASMDPIAFTGVNATIRKFKENPLNPINIIKLKSISSEAMAFLWLAVQTSCSILVCGNTGSGKTTTLNSLFCFLPKDERIVVVEETPEIVLPQTHKIKLNTSEQIGIGLGKLIENTFRMRPDRVIVGEVRGREECEAFVNTMLAGQAKGSYATFHSESSAEAIERMCTLGIDRNSLGSLDLIIVQKRIQRINSSTKKRIEERKVTEICEVTRNGERIELRNLFEFGKRGLLKKEGSQRVKEKIKATFSVDERGYGKLLKEKKNILKKLKGEISFHEFFELAERE